jgi:hypothetical protein
MGSWNWWLPRRAAQVLFVNRPERAPELAATEIGG